MSDDATNTTATANAGTPAAPTATTTTVDASQPAAAAPQTGLSTTSTNPPVDLNAEDAPTVPQIGAPREADDFDATGTATNATLVEQKAAERDALLGKAPAPAHLPQTEQENIAASLANKTALPSQQNTSGTTNNPITDADKAGGANDAQTIAASTPPAPASTDAGDASTTTPVPTLTDAQAAGSNPSQPVEGTMPANPSTAASTSNAPAENSAAIESLGNAAEGNTSTGTENAAKRPKTR